MENVSNKPKIEPTPVFINLSDQVKPDVLARLINRNVSLVYQWCTAGRLPDIRLGKYSYIECIDQLTTSLLKNEEVKLFKAQEEIKAKEDRKTRKFNFSDSEGLEDTMHPLMAAKLEQSVRTEHAREVELWQKIAIKNSEYVNFTDKLELVQPFIHQIRDLLLGIALDFPEAQETIDEGMENLYNMGLRMVEEAKVDREAYIQAMLDTSLKEIVDGNK